jgi:hypothetical protein
MNTVTAYFGISIYSGQLLSYLPQSLEVDVGRAKTNPLLIFLTSDVPAVDALMHDA